MSRAYTHVVPGGSAWSTIVRAGDQITLTTLTAGANVATLVFGADRLDRLNVPDTCKAQMSACIKAPMVLMSDRGLALASVTGSSLDWHDCLTGFGHDRHLERFGPSSYATDRNDWRRSARVGLISELTKHGLGESDLHGCVNFFSAVVPSDDERASLTYRPGSSVAGDSVTLRAEQDVLVVLSTAPHPLDPSDYAPGAVQVEVGPAPVPTSDDPSRLFRDESARALEMAERLQGRVVA